MFNWLFRKSTFHRFQDSYALKHSVMLDAMLDALQARMERGDCVFLVTHFQKTFLTLQEKLETSGLAFSIITEPIDSEKVNQLAVSSESEVFVSMGQMLLPDSNRLARENSPEVAVVVCERHPMPKYDEAISQWCSDLAYPVQLGYFLSLEDPVVKYVVTDQVRMLLEQFGLGENELITSNMVSKRLSSVLKRKAAKVNREIQTECPAEWIKANFD